MLIGKQVIKWLDPLTNEIGGPVQLLLVFGLSFKPPTSSSPSSLQALMDYRALTSAC